MSLGKGLLLVGGTIAVASVMSSSPLVLVSKPLWWFGTTTVRVGAGAIAGIAAGAMAGASAGKIAGSTGTALIVQGLDDVSQQLYTRLSGDSGEAEADKP